MHPQAETRRAKEAELMGLPDTSGSDAAGAAAAAQKQLELEEDEDLEVASG
jgi:hypothetical protein